MPAPAPLQTEFAPAERLDTPQILEQYHEIESEGRIAEVLNAAPYLAVITNRTRQIVFGNTALQDLLDMKPGELTGFRPGELLGCPNSATNPGGCGTSANCRFCGVVHVLLEAAELRLRVVRDARLFIKRDGRHVPYDVRVTATPVDIAGDSYLIVFFDDISSMKKRERLERTFFHDVLNTAGGVRNLAGFLTEARPADADHAARLLVEQTDLLIDEIRSQRLLIDAESDSLAVKPVDIDTLVLFTEARSAAESLREAGGRTIESVLPENHGIICIDPILAKRVLLNLLKNALEAAEDGDGIRFVMEEDRENVVFRVWNAAVMEESVRRQVFQRSFSTKGPGRGIGTYSVRLITEQYLGGTVAFRSAEGAGTEFTVVFPRG